MFSLDNSRAFLLLSLVVIALISSCNSETPGYNNWSCSMQGGYENEGMDYYYYKSNLSDLLYTLSVKSLDNYSFYNGTSSNGVLYGLFFCRGDCSNNACQRCVGNLASLINSNCSSGRSGIMWLEDQCMIRYSDINFFGVADESFSASVKLENYTSPADAKLGILDLMTELVDEALKSDMLFKAGNRPLDNGNGFVYGLVQCTRDLNSTECSKCLKSSVKEILDFCNAGIDCKVRTSSCFLMYANSSFIEQPPELPSLSTPPLLPPSPSQRPPSGNGKTWRSLFHMAIFPAYFGFI